MKAKALNGRLITGEMLLELCLSYTEAINRGGVPCIESAWNYLCKNESQRAYYDAHTLYATQLKKQALPSKD